MSDLLRKTIKKAIGPGGVSVPVDMEIARRVAESVLDEAGERLWGLPRKNGLRT